MLGAEMPLHSHPGGSLVLRAPGPISDSLNVLKEVLYHLVLVGHVQFSRVLPRLPKHSMTSQSSPYHGQRGWNQLQEV